MLAFYVKENKNENNHRCLSKHKTNTAIKSYAFSSLSDTLDMISFLFPSFFEATLYQTPYTKQILYNAVSLCALPDSMIK